MTPPAAPSAAPPALAGRLLRQLLPPLGLMWVVGTGLAIAIAQLFAQRAFDRSLLDDAYLLASHVRGGGAGSELSLALTPRELNTVLFDQAETMFFSVHRADGGLVAGHAQLRMVAPPEGQAHHFADIGFQGRLLRAVTLHRDEPEPFDVTVAQTTTTRDALLRQLLAYSIGPQLLLLLLLALWLRRSLQRELQPLAGLEQAVGHRDASDLRPVPVDASSHEVHALAEALNSLLARLDRSLRAQREFAGNVAHELRTPLAGIRALTSYGLAHHEPAVWREQLEAIARSESRASRLIDRLLAVALAAEAAASQRLVPVRLDALARDAILRFLPRADAAGVDLGAEGIDDAVEVAADPTLVEGILDNLLDNALRYGVQPGAEPPTITVLVERLPGGGAALGVEDNGPGLPGGPQARLVERGAQGETGELLGEGAGLGLALVAQYAQLMKATMALGSGANGRGWSCRVVFPAAPPGAS